DIGKIGVPDAILNKPGALTPDEWVMMRSHSVLGASIVNAVEPLRDLVPIVRSHHERYDGAGYPDQLGGDLVPIEAYVVAAADPRTAARDPAAACCGDQCRAGHR